MSDRISGDPLRGLVGGLPIASAHVVDFPTGLRGFPSARSWAVLDTAQAGVHWLQSLDEPRLVLLLCDPFVMVEGYALDIPASALAALEAPAADAVQVFAIVTLPSGGGDPTANLVGPILVHWGARRGLQLVTDQGGWSVRHPVPRGRFHLAATDGNGGG
jgi:flagellar assembly factor FliW